MSEHPIDHAARRRIAEVSERLGRDLANAQAAIEHNGGAMPESHFTLALFEAVAGHCVDRQPPGDDDETFTDLLVDVFGGELRKLVRGRRTASRSQS